MRPTVDVRPLDIPDDCEAVARVRTACCPDCPVTAGQVAETEARRPRDRLHAAWGAQRADGRVVGFGYIESPGIGARPGRLRIRVLVEPQARRTGVGSRLYDTLLAHALAAAATELVAEAQADDEGAAAFLGAHGFEAFQTRVESRLRLSDVDAAAIARGIDALTDGFFPSGVRIASYRQLQLAVADAPRRLYDLDSTLWADIPFAISGSVPSFEEYLALELQDPDFLPEATFVALDGDNWIGLSALMSTPAGLLNSVTGVVRAWRRRGLARWLKLHTIRCALERGAAEIRTFNDDVNASVLALNASLGFAAVSATRRYRKELR